ncbi:hypothetical protein B7P43_G09997 [Cryptotermes secundus]|uniref:C2H2-type domain-containing protein n=2 Tax=Cryptotermes secundus TaxID=105785 RepID=A0A2J7RH56_9NEOP|nr:hypothetical protein B7P43_G09997 [Cryptotermes secundus]
MSDAQKLAYSEAMQQHMAQVAALQCKGQDEKLDRGHNKDSNDCQNVMGGRLVEYPTTLKVPHVSQPVGDHYVNKPNPESTFVIPDDGMGFDDGVRVLRALGTWSPDYSTNPPRPGMLQTPEHPYSESSHGSGIGGPRKLPTVATAASAVATAVAGKGRGGASKPGGESSSGKSFACTVCGKGLARKDKLVIHMRIHTGEKPYVCEVCTKAFARRDKLVIHMNKMKHRTPSNIAPLGKRGVVDRAAEVKPVKTVEKEASTSVQAPQAPGVTWSCELCGRVFGTRDEWTAHAKGHLEEKMLSSVHQQQQPLQNPSQLGTGCPSGMAPTPYFPPHVQPYAGERHFCLVCRQDFGNKADFMFHVRSHFEGKPPDLDLLARSCGGLVDSSGLCT